MIAQYLQVGGFAHTQITPCKRTSSTASKISKAKIGKSHSIEHCGNISRALSGKTFTNEHRKRISLALMGNTNAAKHKEQFSKDLLKTYCNDEECVEWIVVNRDLIDTTDGIKTETQLNQDNMKESNMYDDGILSTEFNFLDNEISMVELLDSIRFVKNTKVIAD